MKAEEFASLDPGTKLLVGDMFTEDYDNEAEPWLGKVVTFSSFQRGKWVYYEEAPNAPFHYTEIASIYNSPCIDDPDVPYVLGDLSLILQEVWHA